MSYRSLLNHILMLLISVNIYAKLMFVLYTPDLNTYLYIVSCIQSNIEVTQCLQEYLVWIKQNESMLKVFKGQRYT